MKKLVKKSDMMQETLEAYCGCTCPCPCTCGSGDEFTTYYTNYTKTHVKLLQIGSNMFG